MSFLLYWKDHEIALVGSPCDLVIVAMGTLTWISPPSLQALMWGGGGNKHMTRHKNFCRWTVFIPHLGTWSDFDNQFVV